MRKNGSELLRSAWHLIRLYSRLLVLAVGIIFFLLGYSLSEHIHLYVLFMSIGGSLVAAFIAASLVFQRRELIEDLYEDLHREFAARGVISVFADRQDEVRDERWSELIKSTKKGGQCNILGIALGKWARDARTWDAISECVARNVKLRILFLDPISPAAETRAKEDKWRPLKTEIVLAIEKFWEFREGLPNKQKKSLLLATYSTTPSCAIVWSNSTMIVSHYIAGVENPYSPGWILQDVSLAKNILHRLSRPSGRSEKRPLFEVYENNFEEIFKGSEKLTKERIDEFRKSLRMGIS